MNQPPQRSKPRRKRSTHIIFLCLVGLALTLLAIRQAPLLVSMHLRALQDQEEAILPERKRLLQPAALELDQKRHRLEARKEALEKANQLKENELADLEKANKLMEQELLAATTTTALEYDQKTLKNNDIKAKVEKEKKKGKKKIGQLAAAAVEFEEQSKVEKEEGKEKIDQLQTQLRRGSSEETEKEEEDPEENEEKDSADNDSHPPKEEDSSIPSYHGDQEHLADGENTFLSAWEQPFSMDIHSGVIGSPSSTTVSLPNNDGCTCDLVSVDCLETIPCMLSSDTNHLLQRQQQAIHEGIAIRKAIRQSSKPWDRKLIDQWHFAPMGRKIQSFSQTIFRKWMKDQTLPDAYHYEPINSINRSYYPICVERDWEGNACFLDAPRATNETLGDMEQGAMEQLGPITEDQIDKEKHFLRQFYSNQPDASGVPQRWKTSPLNYLLLFSHFTRIVMNMRQHLLDSYDAQVLTIPPKTKPGKVSSPSLRVSLHLRRGDSCDHNLNAEQYSPKPSKLDSHAQVSGNRLCYRTSVYMKQLKRVVDMAKIQSLRVEVYLATDHIESLMDELRKDYPRLFNKVTWKYVEYPREWFDYQGNHSETDFIEDAPTAARLGESAMLDIYHLSHGQVFIGHLGSRFGKLAWWQMLARHNTLVPFFSVDGHSICCDIDEPCGLLAQGGAIASMENCLTFSRPDRGGECNDCGNDYDVSLDSYWAEGSLVRFVAAKEELEVRKQQFGDKSDFSLYNASSELVKTIDHYIKQTAKGNMTEKTPPGEELQHKSYGGPSDAVSQEMKKEPKPARDSQGEEIPWTDKNAPVADWDYFPQNLTPPILVQEPKVLLDNSQCSSLLLSTQPPPKRELSHHSCDGYEGILHIQHGDWGGASGTIFFQFVIAMLQWADQHNYKPWIHMNDVSTKVYDPIVHSGGTLNFTMMDSTEIGSAIDKRDRVGYIFPGKPVRKTVQESKTYKVEGTGIWEHYFMPVSDFVPGDPSCQDKPLIRFHRDHVMPGIHTQAPWTPRAWRIGPVESEYANRWDLTYDEWFAPQRKHASQTVQRYIRFNEEMEQRAACAHPTPENSLGMHIRHGDKWIERTVIEVMEFLPYAEAFVKHGGGSIYVATDSALVRDEIDQQWPQHVRSHVVYQESVEGLSRNGTAAFDLIKSKHKSNAEALTDLLALSKCTYFLHGLSALSEGVQYLNPALIERSVNLEDPDQHRDVKYFVNNIMGLKKKNKNKKNKNKNNKKKNNQNKKDTKSDLI